MKKNKPSWWQNWVVYSLVWFLAVLSPYVGGYFVLGKVSTSQVIIPDSGYSGVVVVRDFNSDALRNGFNR